jgi:tyrosyl-tRNA synthetase
MSGSLSLADLRARGLVSQVTNEDGVDALLGKGGASMYVGFDPTATSLHVGHLLPVMVLAHLQRSGHRPIVVVGGATGMIGDPSGRSSERNLLTPERVQENSRAVRRQLEHFLDFGGGPTGAVMRDNAEWIGPFSFLDWLREVGKHFTVNYMIAKESVRRRLEDRETGISYTEFSYMLLQAYDFLYLYDTYGCRLQGGGNDQWGNITAGVELIRRVRGAEAMGITFPLATTTSGEKFGKSAGNAVWLDPNQTSPYRFYQYWVNVEDSDVANLLRLFTFLPLREIGEIVHAHGKNPDRREAQRVLAREVTRSVHGEDGLGRAERASRALFGTEITELCECDLREIVDDIESVRIGASEFDAGLSLIDLTVRVCLAPSRNEARRLMFGGGLYVNNLPAPSDRTIDRADLLAGRMILLRGGKKNFRLVEVG